MDTKENVLINIKKIYKKYSSAESVKFDNLFDNLEDVSCAEIASYVIELEKYYGLNSLKNIFEKNISFSNLAQIIFEEKINES